MVAGILQGVGGALLTPGSLAMIQASLAPGPGSAIGAWSGLGGVAGAIGPFVGGLLVDNASWRWIFLVNLPLAAATVVIAMWWVPETRDPHAPRRSTTRCPPRLPRAGRHDVRPDRVGWARRTWAAARA